mmetsp:Transcript_140299/g.257679  ORF Transcript_140299/g.257679 Transcript_140299/m.257679 type:complete len:168 (-) Transcript_140299:3-506(-)
MRTPAVPGDIVSSSSDFEFRNEGLRDACDGVSFDGLLSFDGCLDGELLDVAGFDPAREGDSVGVRMSRCCWCTGDKDPTASPGAGETWRAGAAAAADGDSPGGAPCWCEGEPDSTMPGGSGSESGVGCGRVEPASAIVRCAGVASPSRLSAPFCCSVNRQIGYTEMA